ncbi:hypothetical protein ACVXHB_26830 [Escherichia coli]
MKIENLTEIMGIIDEKKAAERSPPLVIVGCDAVKRRIRHKADYFLISYSGV